MIVVLFAFVFVPIDARTAVIHVPIFCPNRIYTALERGTSPAVASACRIPTDAEEDWMIAVKIAPIAIPASGFWKVVIKLMNTSELWRGTIAAPIISIPMKSTPNPAITSLICLTFSFFTNMMHATPTNAKNGAIAPTSRAISCPVMVVPILAPIITHTACLRVISPEFTNPTTMTVVAEDD